MKKSLVAACGFAAIILSSTGCASSSSGGGGSEAAAFESAKAAAVAAQKRAAGVGGEWRDIGKFLKQADAAAASGDYAKAMKLAKKAEFQGNAGYQQAMDEKNAGHPSYLK